MLTPSFASSGRLIVSGGPQALTKVDELVVEELVALIPAAVRVPVRYPSPTIESGANGDEVPTPKLPVRRHTFVPSVVQ